MVQDILETIKSTFTNPEIDFLIRLNEGSPVGHASSRFAGGNISITVSNELLNAEIADIDRFTLVVFIICHEVAHCMCGHLKVNDRSTQDSRSVEAHADFIGARLMSWYFDTLPMNNKICSLGFYKSFKNAPFDQLPDSLLYVKEQILCTDGMGRYPTNDYRLALIIAGFSSYLARTGVLSCDIEHLMAKTIFRSGISSANDFRVITTSNNNENILEHLKQLSDDRLTDKAINLNVIKAEYWFLFATHQQAIDIIERHYCK